MQSDGGITSLGSTALVPGAAAGSSKQREHFNVKG